MLEVPSAEFKGQLGHYLQMSAEEPLIVSKSNKPVAVVMSPNEYEHLTQLEDLFWIARADAAKKTGAWLNHKEAMTLLTQRLSKQ